MQGIEWGMLGFGLASGALGGALFFAGLAIGIRVALRRRHTVGVLLASAATRVVLLLALGTLMTAHGMTAFAGFAAAFVLTRLGVLAVARVPAADETARWS